LDGVLADTMVPFCTILNARHSTQVAVESFVQWNAWEIAHITKDEFFRTLDEAWSDWRKIPPTEEDIGEKVGRLREFGRVDIVTGRSLETVPSANSWLKQHEVPYDTFVRTISTIAKANLTYDLFIDDSADLMSLLASSLDRRGILYTQPWNRKAPEMPRIFRVQRWDEIPSILQQLTAKKS
jgi:uncharacterized HAD superfamily protein